MADNIVAKVGGGVNITANAGGGDNIVANVTTPETIKAVIGNALIVGGGGQIPELSAGAASPVGTIPNTNPHLYIQLTSPEWTVWFYTGSTWQVQTDTGREYLSQLLDVDIPSPTNGQLLAYNATTSKWEAKTLNLDDLADVAVSDQPVTTYTQLFSNTGTTTPIIFFGVSGSNYVAYAVLGSTYGLTTGSTVAATNTGTQVFTLAQPPVPAFSPNEYELIFSSPPTTQGGVTWGGQQGTFQGQLWLVSESVLKDGEVLTWNATSMKWEARIPALPPITTTNTLTNPTNTITSTVNGVAATAQAVNTVTLTNPTNTMTATINGVPASATVVNTVTLANPVNTITSTVNGVSANTTVVNTNTLTNPTNTITSTINGVAATATVVNTVSNTVTTGAQPTLSTTVNGVTGTAVNLPLAPIPPTTNTLTNPVNTLTSTVDGVAATATVVNTVSNTITTGAQPTLTTTVNGVTGTAVNLPVNPTTTNTLTSSLTTGQATSTVDGVAASAQIDYARVQAQSITVPNWTTPTPDGFFFGQTIGTTHNSFTITTPGTSYVSTFTGATIRIPSIDNNPRTVTAVTFGVVGADTTSVTFTPGFIATTSPSQFRTVNVQNGTVPNQTAVASKVVYGSGFNSTWNAATNELDLTVSGGGAQNLTQLTDVQVTEPVFEQVGAFTVSIIDAASKAISLNATPVGTIHVGDWLRGNTTAPASNAPTIQVINVFGNNVEFSADPSSFFVVGNNVYRLPNTIEGNALTWSNEVNRWVPAGTTFAVGLDVISWRDRLGNVNETDTTFPIVTVGVTTNVSNLSNDWTFESASIDSFTAGQPIIITDVKGRLATGIYQPASIVGGQFAVLEQVIFDRFSGGGWVINTAYAVIARQGKESITPIVNRTQSFLPVYDRPYLCLHSVGSVEFSGYLLEDSNVAPNQNTGLGSISFATAVTNDNRVTGIALTWLNGIVPANLASGSSIVIFHTLGSFNLSSALLNQVVAPNPNPGWYIEGDVNCTYGSNISPGTYDVYIAGVTETPNFNLNGLYDNAQLVAGTGIGLSLNNNDITITNTGTGGGGGGASTIYIQSLADDVAGLGFLQSTRSNRAYLGVAMGIEDTGGVIQGVTYIAQNPMEHPYGFAMRMPTSIGGSAVTYSDLTFRVSMPTFNNITIPINITGGSGTPAFYIEPVLVNASYWTSGDPYTNAAQFPLLASPGSEGTEFQPIHAPTFGAVTTGSGNATISSISGGYWVYTIPPNTAYTGTNTDWIVLWAISPSDSSGPTFSITGDPTNTTFLNNGDIEIDLALGSNAPAVVPSLAQVLASGNTVGAQNISLTGGGKLAGNVSALNITGGANGQFLQTDGAGNQIWATPPVILTWIDYTTRWSASPTNVITDGSATNPASTLGNVISYVYQGATRYRFIPTTYDPTADAFYSMYNAGTKAVSGLITARST